MNKFFDPLFWFNQRPGLFTTGFRNVFIGLLVVFLVAAIVSLILKGKKGFLSKFWSKVFNLSLVSFIVGILLLFFNHEMIPFLSSRFWFLLWAIGFITWSVFIIRYLKTLPAKKKELEQEREYKKYIP
jgi:hypothetical protein